MTEEQVVAPEPEATPEAVAEVTEEQVSQETEGQEQGQPAEAEAEEQQSRSKERRERRKAQMQRLRQETDEAKAALDDKNARLAKAQEAAQSNTPPKEADFADHDEYLVALGAFHSAKHMDDRAIRESEEASKAEQERVQKLEKQQSAELAQHWDEQVADARSRYADFDQVVFTAPISDGLANLVAASDQAADVAYYLGANRDEAARLSQMHPIEAARELGRIEATVSLPKPKTNSTTPDPVTPVKPKPSGVKDPAKMSFAEYEAARRTGQIR